MTAVLAVEGRIQPAGHRQDLPRIFSTRVTAGAAVDVLGHGLPWCARWEPPGYREDPHNCSLRALLPDAPPPPRAFLSARRRLWSSSASTIARLQRSLRILVASRVAMLHGQHPNLRSRRTTHAANEMNFFLAGFGPVITLTSLIGRLGVIRVSRFWAIVPVARADRHLGDVDRALLSQRWRTAEHSSPADRSNRPR